MNPITAPPIDYSAILPILIVLGAATVGVLVEAFAPRAVRRPLHLMLALGALLAAFADIAVIAEDTRVITAAGALVIDGPALFMQGTLVVLGIGAILLLGERSLDSTGDAFVADAAAVPGSRSDVEAMRSGLAQTEVFPLAMFAIGGMMVFPSTNNLLVMFVALEVLSLPLYLLAGLARRRRLLSQEAAMKYFLLGAFSSAFFLYGMALLYGYANSLDLTAIFTASQVLRPNDLLLFLGLALLGVGLLFKVGAAPFHSWTPDVYQGSPTPVTAFMASGTKVAAFGALLRVFWVAFGTLTWDWRPVMWGVAILTMVVGAVVAITQTDVKRMLAYSSIAHVGFILTGVVAFNQRGLAGSMFYLVAYGFTTIGSFAVVSLVRDADGEATHLRQWQGLGRKSPAIAALFAFFLFALAGIPLTSGFTSKFAVFQAATQGGALPLVIVGVVASAVTAFFYARVVVLMFFQEPPPEGPDVAVPGAMTSGALALGLAVTVVLGIVPGPLLDLADSASVFLR